MRQGTTGEPTQWVGRVPYAPQNQRGQQTSRPVRRSLYDEMCLASLIGGHRRSDTSTSTQEICP